MSDPFPQEPQQSHGDANSEQVEDNSWLASGEAYALLCHHAGDRKKVQSVLKRALRNGTLRAQAAVEVTGISIMEVKDAPPTSEDGVIITSLWQPPNGGRINITPSFWKSCMPTLEEPKPWKWMKGIFVSLHPVKVLINKRAKDGRVLTPPRLRSVAYGVEFAADEIDQLVSLLPAHKLIMDKLKFNPEIKQKRWNWAFALKELKEMIANGYIDTEFGKLPKPGVQAKIEKYVAGRLMEFHEDQPEMAYIRQVINPLLVQLKSRPLFPDQEENST